LADAVGLSLRADGLRGLHWREALLSGCFHVSRPRPQRPNLNLLGAREPEIYGAATLDDIRASLAERCAAQGVELAFKQSNFEAISSPGFRRRAAGAPVI